MVSANLHYNCAKETKTRVYDLEVTKTWVMNLNADGSEIVAFMTREQLRELYITIGNAIGFSLPSALVNVEVV
jgi:hypothetical protein